MPVSETIYKEDSKNSVVYSNISEMIKVANFKKMLDGSELPKEDKFLVSPALSYCNFSIANIVILMSKYWKEDLPESIKYKDKQAFEILQKLFLDRKIVAIDAIALNLGGGGLHCNTKHIPLLKK